MGRLKKNIAYNIIYQVLILIIPLVTSAYLSRVLGADGIGRYSYSYSIALYFTYFTLLGLNKYGNRVIASVQKDIEIRSRCFWEIYSMQTICFFLCITTYLFYVKFIASDKSIAFIESLFVLSSLFDINWFFFGMELFDKTVIRNTIVKVLSTILIFVFVKDHQDTAIYASIMSVGYLGSQLALWPYLKKYVVKVKLSLHGIFKHISPNLLMFLPVIAVSIYKVMSKILLGIFSSNATIGYYENAEKIINVPIAIVTAFGTVMLPRVSALIAQGEDNEVSKFRDYTISIVIAFTVASFYGICAIGDSLAVVMWGSEFYYSGVIMKILAFTLVFLGIGDVVRSQFLIPYKFDKVYVISAFLGAIVNVIVNLLLIPKFDAIGAAIATAAAEIVVCIYQIYKVRASLQIKKYLKDIILFSFIGIIMYAFILKLPNFQSGIITLMVDVIVGGLIYLIPATIILLRKYHNHFGEV